MPFVLNSKFKRGLLGLMLLGLAIAFWARSPGSPKVHLSFLYVTNQTDRGKVGAFAIANNLNEAVNISGGHFQPGNRSGKGPEKGDAGATFFSPQKLGAHATNVIHIQVPPSANQDIKLVLYATPASKSTPQQLQGLRRLYAQYGDPSFTTFGRWRGVIFVSSQPFKVR